MSLLRTPHFVPCPPLWPAWGFWGQGLAWASWASSLHPCPSLMVPGLEGDGMQTKPGQQHPKCVHCTLMGSLLGGPLMEPLGCQGHTESWTSSKAQGIQPHTVGIAIGL